jgi:hypothetical protein
MKAVGEGTAAVGRRVRRAAVFLSYAAVARNGGTPSGVRKNFPLAWLYQET